MEFRCSQIQEESFDLVKVDLEEVLVKSEHETLFTLKERVNEIMKKSLEHYQSNSS